ncbi:arf-GAP with Rho-GAP domain, ANK repeat and PH domain-containing protein 1-like [Vombatus ursinus]|uniref:arf-GAP with Rho-GAP domain, ANK repeat and PH domain-containing protein 1-like n=1 Tax=Vombatus ursinus TaxID=29139 RepID=UPI000FFCEA68|nr:arf-GAP with Rho-GAP domain, ANK repeat and PH domain-containing protein 1-like [Vombatus ursinus]
MAEEVGALLPVAEWLRALHLEQYAGHFEQYGLVWAADCRGLNDGQLLHMGVTMPGHRRRILSGLQRAYATASEEPRGPAPAPAPRGPPRPVPAKRHVFRSAPAPDLSLAPAPAPSLSLATAMVPTLAPGPALASAPVSVSASVSVPAPVQTPTLVPSAFAPPIPPRRSCRPPAPFASLELGPSRDPVLPPLPAKRHQVEARAPCIPPRSGPPKPLMSLPTEEEKSLESELDAPLSPISQIPSQPPPLALSAPEIPPKPSRLLPEFDDSDYDELPEEGPPAPSPTPVMVNKEEPSLQDVPRTVSVASLLSEGDELAEDPHCYEDIPNGIWDDVGLRSPSLSNTAAPELPLHPMEGPPWTSTPSTPVIKVGWLDKNPPQGPHISYTARSYIYQKRWVRLDSDYLRYFDSDKDAYSKRFIPVSSISRVSGISDQKFEVITHNRTFVFRAESDAERKDWMQALQQAVEEQRGRARLSKASPLEPHCPGIPDQAGSLELRGVKSKLYVVVVGDKVLLYKNLEEYQMGIGITFIDMSVGNVKDSDRRSFDLTTPYRIFSFSAESESEKAEWLEAMQGAIAEALSTMDVAEQIWADAPNRHCADCGAPHPDWASINLCLVICKRCAGEHRWLGPSISKVRSLKMDRKVWTEDLIELFHHLGNEAGKQFWAANVPPSEALHPSSSPGDRRHHLEAKYREGKYRRYHRFFGKQEELDKNIIYTSDDDDDERPLHYTEKVLPILHSLGTDSHLVVKKYLAMEAMLMYLASKVGDTKHGMMKFREDRSLLGLGLSTGSFHDRYFMLNSSCLRLFKEIRNLKQHSGGLENVSSNQTSGQLQWLAGAVAALLPYTPRGRVGPGMGLGVA